MKDISIKYIQPTEITSLEDIDWGTYKRGIIVCNSNEINELNLHNDDLLFLTDLKEIRYVKEDGHISAEPLVQVHDIIEILKLTDTDIRNKSVHLSLYPIQSIAKMYVDGLLMYQNQDYTVTGNVISWANSDLVDILVENDIIFVAYRI